jgi:D-lactate dehydrogenase
MVESAVKELAESGKPTRAPDFACFEQEVAASLPRARIVTDPLRRRVFGIDASFYRLVPEVVLLAESEAEVSDICRIAQRCGTAVTFRAAGTSLSGQAVTDSVLVRLSYDGWRDWEILEDATAIRLQPGLTGAQANARLAPYGRKIGPDPASINAAMIGGIAANNASGMCCGVAQNSYQTLKSLRVVLADGTILDTGDPANRDAFRKSHGGLLGGLAALAQRTRDNKALAQRIRDKYRIKNTTGYSLNALIDFDDPFDILAHLMIGSEGTLGFFSEVTYRTVPDPAHKATALVFFPTTEIACRAVAALKPSPVSAVEIMDRAALRSVTHRPEAPAVLKDLPDQAAALLIDVRAEDSDALSSKIVAAETALSDIETLEPLAFSRDAKTYAALWSLRKGMFPSVGAMRETGTTVIIEDVAVSTEKLAGAVVALQRLFAKHGYDEAIIFGHALEGNVHFVFTQDFSAESEIKRYGAFMDDVAEMIVKDYDGSLKAEHSTGQYGAFRRDGMGPRCLWPDARNQGSLRPGRNPQSRRDLKR